MGYNKVLLNIKTLSDISAICLWGFYQKQKLMYQVMYINGEEHYEKYFSKRSVADMWFVNAIATPHILKLR